MSKLQSRALARVLGSKYVLHNYRCVLGKLYLGVMSTKRIVLLVAALGAALFIFARPSRAADWNFPIYFEGAKLVVKAHTTNRTMYVLVIEMIEFMGRQYTYSLALEALTMR